MEKENKKEFWYIYFIQILCDWTLLHVTIFFFCLLRQFSGVITWKNYGATAKIACKYVVCALLF